MADLMQWEEDVIVNSMFRKSSKDIAATLGIDHKLVESFIKLRSVGYEMKTTDAVLNERKIIREKKRPAIKRKAKKEVKITSATIDQPHFKRRVEKPYKTLNQDFTKLVPVKIDHKTIIYLKPGTDLVKAKKLFLKNSNYKTS